MKPSFLLALGSLFFVSTSPAHAFDCAKASTPVEKMFCDTPELKKADEAMSATYFKLLRETKDPEFHEALVQSQRRWVEQRSSGPDRFGAAESDNTDDRVVLLKMTRDRLNFLQGGQPIRTMERQRQIVSKDSGGSFAGYKTNCTFMPPPYGDWIYLCWGEVHRQHRDKICSVGTEWASGHTTEYRLVSVLRNGEPKPVASCSIGYGQTSAQCPELDDDADAKARAHWNTNPRPDDDLPMPRAEGLWKYDPDAGQADQPWMRDCLFTSIYPPPEMSRPDPAPK